MEGKYLQRLEEMYREASESYNRDMLYCKIKVIL